MFHNIFYKIKGSIVAFGRMSLKQSEVVFMNLLHAVFSKGMYFFAFYFVFLFDPHASTNSNMSGVILAGIAIVGWVLLANTLKDYKMENITPYKGALTRGLFDVRYIVLIGIMFYYFNLTYSPKEFYIYLVVIVGSLILARLCEARKLSILGKDWLVYESRRN
jgi:hypothetical protein